MQALIHVAASDELVLVEASIGDQYILDRIDPDSATKLAIKLLQCADEARQYIPDFPTTECHECKVTHALSAVAANHDQCPSCGCPTIYF